MTPQDERIKELEAKLVGAEYEREAMASLWYEGKKSMQDQLTEAQAEIERLRVALGKVARADCPIYIAHPQSVWWNEHVVSKAAETLAEGKEEK